MFQNTESMFAALSCELGLSPSRFTALDPVTNSRVWFTTMEEMVAWVRS